MRSEPQHEGTSSVRSPPLADDAVRDRPASSSVAPPVIPGALPRAVGRRRPSSWLLEDDAPAPEESPWHSDGEPWRGDQAAGGSQADGRPPRLQTVSNLNAGAGRRRTDDVSAQGSQNAIAQEQLNAALHEINGARGIVRFSTAVVQHDKALQRADGPNHAIFLKKAAVRFTRELLPNLEQDIDAWKSWGYATTCNAVSREAGGQEGKEACRAMAARVAQLDHALISQVDPKALSLLSSSFGRHFPIAECRNGMIRIAKVCRDDRSILQELNSQSLALLVNGFSKWPEDCHGAIVAIAREVHHRADQLSRSKPQELSTLVNGLSKWPQEENTRRAALAIAREVLRRTNQLSGFNPQELANLVNGFAKWPDDCRPAIVAIANEINHRPGRPDARLAASTSQGLAHLVNGFSKWPEDCRGAIVAIAREVGRRAGRADVRLSDFTRQDLATLVNGFSKWPQDCRGAIVAIAREVHHRADQLPRFNAQELSTLVNGLSKWPQAEECRQAAVVIGGELLRRDRLSDFSIQNLAILLNGLAKWPQDCRGAIVAIAGEVGRHAGHADVPLSGFVSQDLATLVNGISKWPEEAECRKAIAAIAGEVSRSADQLSGFSPQVLATLVNGFGKWPEAGDCRRATAEIAAEVHRRATAEIAGEVHHRADQLPGFNAQELSTLVNGFSKWPQEENTRHAALAIAGEVLRRANKLSGITPQNLSNLVNGFSKWPEQADCREATGAIAREVRRRAGRLSGFNPQDMANLVNGFSKWPHVESSRDATVVIADEVCRCDDQLSGFIPQDLATLVNGLSKWPEEAECREAIATISGEVLRRANQLPRFNLQNLANLVNGFSKWLDGTHCREATVAIAGEMLRRADQLSEFTPQDMANLSNGFSKWPEEAACHQAIIDIAHRLGSASLRFGVFTTAALGTIANDLARGVMKGEDAGEINETALLKDRLHKLAHHLHYATDRLEQANALTITNIFKALAKARLVDDLGLLARTGLDRLQELHRAPGFAAENNLETVGNLCAALLPLARSPHKQLRWHRRQALNLLNDIQPVVEQKIEAHLNASDAERARGPCSSRCPALSIYQVLKTRAVLERLYRRPYVEGDRFVLRNRQQQLQRETRGILGRTRDLIERDLSNMSWNVIAEIEADNPLDAVDSFLEQNAATVHAQHPASVFDVHQVLRTMDHEPRPPQGDAGLMQLPVVDMQGRPVATEAETRYSIFHRLTSGAVKVVAVQLPGKPSTFMLTRTLTVEGVPYRMDLFGGSKLKPPRLTLAQIASRQPGGRLEPSGGKLLAIPYSDTAAGTDFERLSRAWAPFKEAYYYTQRRGFAAPPALQGLGPHDYALEGAFKLSLMPDRPANEQHPFKLTGKAGPIALQPHDGCGFIKASLAALMPAIRRAGPRNGPDRMAAFGEGRRSSLPASALQHYPRSELVADEAREKARTWLESQQGRALTSEELFRTVTTGHIDGPGAVAVPSGDGRVHVPTLKSETLTGTGGVLIGRSPYDKPNLRPFAAGQVRSAVDGDPTAGFLDQCVAIQYSFNVAQKSGEKLAAADPTFFAKGILIVVPDEMWPADYAERGLVMSAEDVKSHSSWTTSKDRVTVDTSLDCVGILQATEVFAPGSLVAVPTGEQKKLDGDFDGDTVIILGDRPRLYEHVREFDQKEQARGLRSLKPPKSHTPAIDGERYQFSRASQILAATQNVLETYTSLQRNFLAQPHEARQWFAERAIFGIYEGVNPELRHGLRELLDQEQASRQDIQDKLDTATHEIEVARHPVAREMAALLISALGAWAVKPDEQRRPETVESVNDANPGLSAALCALFPDLAEAYPATPQPRERVQLLLNHCPARIDPRPDGYNPDDLVESANNLLSLGVKVGTDAYKSDTGARLFMKKSEELQRLLHQTPGLKAVPYVKGLAATLNRGGFNVDATLGDLKGNPTLAASIMETSIKLATEQGILRNLSARQPAAEDCAMTITLTREEASERARMEASRAREEEEAITAAALGVATSLATAGIQVNMPHMKRRLKSAASMTAHLTGMSAPSSSDVQLLSSAVRHVFEVPDQDFTRAFKAAMLAFDERGYSELQTTNWFRTRNPNFVGIQSVLTTPDGYRFQLEFHTPGSYQAKIDNHDTYKELFALQQQVGGDGLEKAGELVQRVRGACNQVATPDGAMDVPHWGAEEGATGRTSLASFGVRAAEQPGPPQTARSPVAKEIFAALNGRPVVLVGMPSAGKSSIGPALARRLRLPFVDTDKIIQKQAGTSISQIFATNGEAFFRDMEARVIADLLQKGPAVIATGGGAFMREQSRHLIGEKAVSIWLDTRLDVIEKRTRNDTSRPLLQGPNPEQKIARLLSERRPFYAQADITVVPPHQQDRKNVDPCVSALHAHLCPEAGDNRGPAVQDADRLPEPAAQPTATAGPTPHSRVAQTDEPASGSGSAPQDRLALGPTDWLTDAHITADYGLLGQELQGRSPDLAARTRLVDPLISYQ
ncbi:shikimate kinase, partial [Mesorhizobium sp. YC-39]|uniref:shikimate kinase n=1 Tax=unclassified Mesorhizobium TaxID=325217 RepID=UPI0039931FCD